MAESHFRGLRKVRLQTTQSYSSAQYLLHAPRVAALMSETHALIQYLTCHEQERRLPEKHDLERCKRPLPLGPPPLYALGTYRTRAIYHSHARMSTTVVQTTTMTTLHTNLYVLQRIKSKQPIHLKMRFHRQRVQTNSQRSLVLQAVEV